MTIFIVSLFNPYTVNFDVPEPEVNLPRRSPPVPRARASDQTGLENHHFHGQVTPPLTRRSTMQDQTLATLGGFDNEWEASPMLESVDPMSSFEPRAPLWGKASVLNQPIARVQSPPPISVLLHDNSSQRDVAQLKYPLSKQPRPEGFVKADRDHKFSKAKWTVQTDDLRNAGLCNAVAAAVDQGILGEKLWVGTLGMPTDVLDDETKSSISEKLEQEYDTLTVLVADKDMDGHYSHYCKTMLWPVFHYQIPDGPKSKAYQDHSWKYYVRVNQAFADCIAKNYKKGDVVWIHDYHLLLLPSMLRKCLPEAKIGFFLHIAFPSSEVFRCLATRKELLEGVLGANLIGFQTDEYCHHFLQTCSRLLGVEVKSHGVQLDNRFVNANTFPIGIDPSRLDQSRDDPSVAEWAKIISEKYRGKKIIIARDKMDYIRGVRPKLLAYESFLKAHPEWKEKVVFIQVATSTTEQAEQDAPVADVITRINSHTSTVADVLLVYLKQDIPYSQYLALLTAADCLMVTSLREGMNLTTHEYVNCQDGRHSPRKHGPLILSEYTGTASIFGGDKSLLVNPWNIRQCAEAIKTALEMSGEEKARRWYGLSEATMTHTGARWFKTFTTQLDRVWDEQSRRDYAAIPRLSYDQVKSKYGATQHRLFILDYDGPLASWGTPSSIIQSTPRRALGVLNDLVDDACNTVYVMSGLMPEEMEPLLRQVPGVGLIAENGCYVLEPSDHSEDSAWTSLIDETKVHEWKESMRGVLNYYQERIEGSCVEERHCSFVLNYRNAADASVAKQQMAECADAINGLCQDQHIQASPAAGQMIVEHIRVNKATATAMIAKDLRRNSARAQAEGGGGKTVPDFLFVSGDSRQDEHVFRWANKQHSSQAIQHVFTVSLCHGRSTEATATLTGVPGVLKILQRLVGGR